MKRSPPLDYQPVELDDPVSSSEEEDSEMLVEGKSEATEERDNPA